MEINKMLNPDPSLSCRILEPAPTKAEDIFNTRKIIIIIINGVQGRMQGACPDENQGPYKRII